MSGGKLRQAGQGRLIGTVVSIPLKRLRVMPAGAPRLLAGRRVEPYVSFRAAIGFVSIASAMRKPPFIRAKREGNAPVVA